MICALGACPLHPFHHPPQLALGSSFPMDRRQHQYLRIQITLQNIQRNFLSAFLIVAIDTAPLPWCHSDTLSLDSLPLDEHADW